jgi:multiple sugar transport system substrate-binding protein
MIQPMDMENQRRDVSMTEKRKISTMSRRDFLRTASLTGGAAILVACAAPSAQAPAGEQTAGEATVNEPAASKPVTISWWNEFSTPTCQEIFPKVVKAFTDRNPNITVEFEITGGPPGGGNYTEVLLARIAAGNPPEVITLWTPPSEFGARGALASIDNYMSSAEFATPDAFFDAPLNSCKWAGKTYGLPASAGAGCLFINKPLFEEAGVSSNRADFPTKWDGLIDLSAKLVKAEGGDVTQAGFVPWLSAWLRPVWSELNGGKIFDAKENKYQIDTPENEAVLQYWLRYLDEQYGGDVEKFSIIANWDDVYPESAFNMGLSAMSISGSWACTDAGLPFDWEVVKFPYGPGGSKSVTGFWPNWFSMPKGVKNPEEGFLFTEWMTTEGWVIWYVEATMDTPAWKNVPEGKYTKKLGEMVGEDRAQDLHNFFAEYLVDAAEMWTSPIEGFASDTLNQSIDEVMHKTTSPKVALAQAQATIQSKLDETLQSL